jgi:ribonucleotide reductase class II
LSEDFFLRSDHRTTYLTLGEERSNDWLRVASVEPLSEPQEVLCATVPEYEQFVIEGFCLTRNCAFVSTKNIRTEFAEPFCFLMDMSMLGVGVAFDCEGAETVRIVQPKVGKDTYVIPDSKEGWVEALRKVLTPYVGEGKLPAGFDFSEIRPAGTPIRTFGGIAPGPGPLKECLEKIRVILDKVVGRKITSTDIVDLMNIIGKCVVAGGVRRCLPEGTEVHTRRGLLPIEDVSVGDEVRTTEGWRKVVENVYQGRQPVVDIRTQLGDFRCTPQHRMKVFTGLDSFAWKRACDLVPGDRLVFHNAVEESGEETALPAWSYDRPKHSTTCKDIVVPHLDTDMAWFLGYLHGNGYVNAKEVSVSVPATRLNVVRAVEDALSRFGVKVFRTEATEEDDSVKVRVKSRQLALYLGQFKQANTAMRVPDCIKRGRGSLRAAYLGGLYDSDGTAENRPVLLATSVYPSFLREVQNLAATLGVATRLAPKTAKGRKPQWKPLYLLTVVGERFTERIEAWAERYSLKFQRNAVSRRSQNDYGYPADWVVSEGVKYGKHWDRKCRQMTERTLERATGTERTVTPVEVFSVEPVEGEEETYDLSVEGNHEFVVGPGLVSHNTAELALGLADDPEYLRLKDPETNGDKLREWRWASNNSILAKLGMDYTKVGRQTAQNGEPGYFWLENARAYGRMKDPADYRDAEVMGTNPCCEQSLESYEACVDGSTLIHTKTGVSTLKDLVGREVEVWNGVAWSKVVPRQTGSGRELFRVHLSDGSRLDCTANHGWSVRPKGKRKFRRVETRDLAPGDRVSAFALPEGAGGRFEPYAYEYGVFLGDGHFDNGKPVVTLCGAKTALAQTALAGTPYKPYHPEGYADPTRRVSFSGILDKERCRSLKARNGLPGFVLGMDAESIRAFVAGWIDTDGSVVDQGQTQAYRLYGSEADLLDLQVLLRRIGVNHASVTLFARAGEETNKGVRNHDLWYLHIPSFECRGIPTVLKRAERIGPRYRANNAFPGGAPVDRARKQHVVRVERLPGLHDTFCFDEPERHMGVFGNALTYQCNLVETFPSRHDSFEEYKRTLKFAYLYAKTVTLIPTHNERTNAIMLRNRRIGLSQSGIVESFRKIGRREHLRWCDEGYAYVTELDKIYSRWLCIPASIKKTTVKPSGTVSLLPGVTPGIHYPHSEYYLRRIRVQVQSPLWRAIQKAGYPVEESVYGDGTMVCTFPVHEKNYDRAKHEVSIWEQVENAALMQYYWSDNQVSVTVTFRPEEAKDIPHILELFEHRLKGISFLPLKDHGYAQAPYEEIDRETFEALTANLRPLDFSEVDRVEETEKFCTTDSCEIRSCRDAAEHAEKPSVAANA